ncbi:hypothetical protein PMIN01_11756 [Paraphaeosphaeria minitans]|uniref:Uncharacterized protein n=1 Tax=Paraphaeosphaeria minitans TaxID=565426 RepID=A0A9P6G7A9_9PLEO|nr:hypothetical protein PMIN01_11756 [Paraphaeosphaeria minitans]
MRFLSFLISGAAVMALPQPDTGKTGSIVDLLDPYFYANEPCIVSRKKPLDDTAFQPGSKDYHRILATCIE